MVNENLNTQFYIKCAVLKLHSHRQSVHNSKIEILQLLTEKNDACKKCARHLPSFTLLAIDLDALSSCS